MRSRFSLEGAAVMLGAAAEGVWCGALAAALTRGSWPLLAVFAWATVAAGAFVARRLRGRDEAERAARFLAVTLVLCATGLLLLAGRAWTHPLPLWQAARDFVYCVGLVLLGISLGRAPRAPEVAVRRAVRGFALLCVVLVAAAAAGWPAGWAPAAVVTSLVAGGLLIAVARYEALSDLVDRAERLPAWPWLLAVLGTVLVVVAVGALLSQVFRVDGLLWALHGLGGVLRFALDAVGFAIGWAGAALVRGVGWVLGALHITGWHAKWTPPLAPKLRLGPALHDSRSLKLPSAGRLVLTLAGAILAIAALLAVVALALRRIRREPREDLVVEEREELASLRSAAGKFAGRLGRRIRSRLQGLRRHGPLAPAELVRRRYAELERRLAKSGRPRPPGVTVREYLAAVAGQGGESTDPSAATSPAEPVPDEPAVVPSPSAAPLTAAGMPAADLSGIYELARYSAHGVDATLARRFDSLARAFEA